MTELDEASAATDLAHDRDWVVEFGAIVGGSIASSLLVEGTWRDIFWLGAGMTIAFLPAIILLVPESPEIILRRNAPDRALAKINRTMKRLGHAALDTVVPIARDETGDRSGLFRGAMRRITTLLVIAYFFLLDPRREDALRDPAPYPPISYTPSSSSSFIPSIAISTPNAATPRDAKLPPPPPPPPPKSR